MQYVFLMGYLSSLPLRHFRDQREVPSNMGRQHHSHSIKNKIKEIRNTGKHFTINHILIFNHFEFSYSRTAQKRGLTCLITTTHIYDPTQHSL